MATWSYKLQVGSLWDFNDSRGLNNAVCIYDYFTEKGFTIQSICGMLGNMWRESHLNPGQKQTLSTKSGWGLIQWTPSTALTGYTSVWYSEEQMDIIYKEIMRITPFAPPNARWLNGSGYTYTGAEFAALTDISEATKAYLYERERAGVEALDERIEYAGKYYEYLSGKPVPPTPPPSPTPTPTWLPGAVKSLQRLKVLH